MLNDFMVRMARSQHTEGVRVNALKAGLRGYFKMVEGEVMGTSKINRPADEGKREREICKILGPTEWFQPRHLQSPEVCKEEEVAVTSKSRSAHKLGRNGQRGCKVQTSGRK